MSRLTLNNNAANPSAPAASKLFVFSKTDKLLYIEDDAGLVSPLALASGASASTFTLGSTSIALGSTTTTVAGLTLSGGTLSGTTTLPGSGQISSAGWLGLGGTPAAQLHLQGNLSAAAWTISGIAIRSSAATYTDTSSSGTVPVVAVSNIGQPTLAASSATTYTVAATLRLGGEPLAGTNVTITNTFSLLIAGTSDIGLENGSLLRGADGTGTWRTFARVGASFIFLGGDKVVVDPATGNVGISSGTTVAPQSALQIGTTAATARIYNSFTDASNGEWAYLGSWGPTANVATFGPDKNGTGTYRVGRWVSGGNTIWESLINGDFRIGTGAAIATTATGGFIKIATCAGTPTGVPANANTGSAEVVYDSTGKKLWIYDNATAAWLGVVVA